MYRISDSVRCSCEYRLSAHGAVVHYRSSWSLWADLCFDYFEAFTIDADETSDGSLGDAFLAKSEQLILYKIVSRQDELMILEYFDAAFRLAFVASMKEEMKSIRS